MKVMGVPHIAVIPFLKCNFSCPYCVSYAHHDASFGIWDERFNDIKKFLNSLDKKMIMVSGGEPLIWRKWERLIEETDHYWYFLSNCSVVPSFLRKESIKRKVKLFISAYHRSQIDLGRFIDNLREIQSLGYPVFCKIIYEKEPAQIGEAEKIIAAGIPTSFVPLLHAQYSEEQLAEILPYCQSAMYASRFFPPDGGPERKIGVCEAGTSESFQITGFKITRCSQEGGIHFGDIYLPNSLKDAIFSRGITLLRKIHFNNVYLSTLLGSKRLGYLGNIYAPRFYAAPTLCRNKTCACEWHNFSGMSFDFENEKWQHFIDTGEWIPATYEDKKRFVEEAGGKFEVRVKADTRGG
jgi:organic radical activating enzyme